MPRRNKPSPAAVKEANELIRQMLQKQGNLGPALLRRELTKAGHGKAITQKEAQNAKR